MKKAFLLTGLLLLFVIVLGIPGARYFSPAKAEALRFPFVEKEKPSLNSEISALHVKTDKKVYATGEPAAVSFVLLNTAEHDVNLTFNSGQTYDLELWREEKRVWRWSADKAFTLAIRERILAPGEFIHEVILISPQVTSNLAAGEYELKVLITAVQLRNRAKSVELEFR